MHVVNTAGTRTTLSNMLGTSRHLMLVALGWLFLVVMRGSEAGEAHHPFAVMLLFLKIKFKKKISSDLGFRVISGYVLSYRVIVKNVNFYDTEELAVFLDLVPNVKQKLRSLLMHLIV